VQPRASRNEITGVHGDMLKVRLMAPPVDGAANAALTELIARTFDVPTRSVRIVSGATSRTKSVEIDGVSASEVTSHLRR
jgi:uncharacterized protein (TIGR00251 family)